MRKTVVVLQDFQLKQIKDALTVLGEAQRTYAQLLRMVVPPETWSDASLQIHGETGAVSIEVPDAPEGVTVN